MRKTLTLAFTVAIALLFIMPLGTEKATAAADTPAVTALGSVGSLDMLMNTADMRMTPVTTNAACAAGLMECTFYCNNINYGYDNGVYWVLDHCSYSWECEEDGDYIRYMDSTGKHELYPV